MESLEKLLFNPKIQKYSIYTYFETLYGSVRVEYFWDREKLLKALKKHNLSKIKPKNRLYTLQYSKYEVWKIKPVFN